MAEKTYPDLSFREGQHLETWTHQGRKVKRTFLVDDVDISTPTSTLDLLLTGAALDPANPDTDIPGRMTPHPTIIMPSAWSYFYYISGIFNADNCFCADVLTAKPKSSTQVEVEAEYAVFNALNQEPSDYGDVAPPFVTVGSTVQMRRISKDIDGNPLNVPYLASGPTDGSLGIVQTGPGNTSAQYSDRKADPISPVISEVEFPCMLLRLQRREQNPRNPIGLEGYVNDQDIIFPTYFGSSFTVLAETALCTRVENETQDNGQSWIVTYEFQIKGLESVPSGSNFVSPAIGYGIGDTLCSPWTLNALYKVTAGCIGVDSSSTKICGPGEVPFDAVPSIFQVYETVDFNTIFPNLP